MLSICDEIIQITYKFDIALLLKNAKLIYQFVKKYFEVMQRTEKTVLLLKYVFKWSHI